MLKAQFSIRSLKLSSDEYRLLEPFLIVCVCVCVYIYIYIYIYMIDQAIFGKNTKQPFQITKTLYSAIAC